MSDDDKTIFCFLGGRHVELPLSSYDHLMRQLFALAEDRDAALAERDEWQGLEEKEAEALAFVQAEKADLRAQLAAVTKERDDMQALLDLQWTRSREADKLWQAAHPGNDNVWPDLGELLVWLMERGEDAARLRAAIADTKDNVEYLAEASFDGDWGVANEEEREDACDAVAPFLRAARARAGVKL